MDRLYGIRPDYCLALRLIGCQEFSRRNQEFVEKHFKGIFMEREMEAEIERLEARIEELAAALREFNFYLILDSDKDTDTLPVLIGHIRAARAAYLGKKND